MNKNYKLKEEIKEFIIGQKKGNPKLSCRGLAILIKERFQVEISKSLINNVIKEHNLSSPVGRRGEKKALEVKKPVEPQVVKEERPVVKPVVVQGAGFMECGGFFFLMAADLKLGLSSRLAEVLSSYFPDLSRESHQGIIEASIYSPFVKESKSLSLLIGKEVSYENIAQYLEHFIQVPLPQLREAAGKVGISRNINDINGLWRECLFRLNAYIVHFFPPEYQFLDFFAMQERFYCLPGRLERKGALLIIQLFCPSGFFWMNDIIWQEGFTFAANRVNEARIISPHNEQIWINPQVQFQ